MTRAPTSLPSTTVANLASLVIAAAIDFPDRPALKLGDTSLTYAQFDLHIRRVQGFLQHHLREASAANLVIVAFKSINALVLAQAALRLGWHYTVIDPRYPTERIQSILAQCHPQVLFSDLEPALLASVLTEDMDCLLIDGTNAENGTHGMAELEDWLPVAPGACASIAGDETAFMFYTSGSTGVPKAVPITHTNARYAIDWAQNELRFAEDDVFLNQAHMGFDFCVLDYYNAWNVGASIVLVEEFTAIFSAQVVDLIVHEQVTNLWLVPSNVISLIEHGGLLEKDPSHLRRFLYAGEPFPVKYLQRVYDWMDGRNVYNLYGPTETNLLTFHKVCSADLELTDIPIGMALPGTELAVIGDDGEFRRSGRGELVASSPSVFPGYVNRPDLNETKFLQREQRRWYRTGDLCDIDDAGCIRYLGRTDSMVKVRGYRIELQEVELAFCRLPQMRRAVAVARRDCKDQSAEIALFCVVDDDSDATQLRRAAGRLLPSYMVPATITVVDDIPFNGRGKIDTQALLEKLT